MVAFVTMPFKPLPLLKCTEFSDLVESMVSVRRMPFALTGLGGFEGPWSCSSSFMRLSWWCSVAVPLALRPALSGWPGCGVWGRDSKLYVPFRDRVPGTRASGAPVLL